jgi:molybdate transport system regulatory protein
MESPVAKQKAKVLELRGNFEIARLGRRYLGGSRIDLLEAIDRRGSISQGAKDVDLSYKAAWDAVDAMNNLAEQPLLIRAIGGQHGGGSYLTAHGREIIRLYRLLESGYQRLFTQMQAQVHDFDKLNDLLRTINMKTSARNQFRGTVKTVRKGAVNADVILDLGDGLEIFANITNEAVEDLGLKKGREAVALIKSSLVLLSPDPHIKISARNRLSGTITAIIRGSVNSEVKIQLNGGRVLTAIITEEGLEELDLAEGTPCTALVKASHVLIAVND